MNSKLAVPIAAFLCGASAMSEAQRLHPTSIRPKAGEMTLASVQMATGHLLSVLGEGIGSRNAALSRSVAILEAGPRGRRTWTVNVPVSGGLSATYEARSGRLLTVFRASDFSVAESAPLQITTADEARARLVGLAKSLGLPAGAQLTRFSWYPVYNSRQPEMSARRLAAATFLATPRGYPFFEYPIRLTISISLATGKLSHYDREDDTVVGPVHIVLEPARAVALARAALHRAPSAQPILGWAVPNGMFGAPNATRLFPHPAVLVYSVPFGGSTVWIDASTGATVGGLSAK